MSPLTTELDHLVVVAESLAQGAQWCRNTLGVEPQAGGAHAQMGTHNLLLSIGDGAYLEIIAIDPAAPVPSHPRWFDMDSADSIRRAQGEPFLAAFVARTSDLDSAIQADPRLGSVRQMRRGDLQWKIAVPEDGALLDAGAMPILIEWPAGEHPTKRLPLSRCKLQALEIGSEDEGSLRSAWERLGLRASGMLMPFTRRGDVPPLKASFATPHGLVSI